MYYCKSRYYIPEWCRWLNADSIEYINPEHLNGINLYAYCNNNPVMYTDPNGNLAFLTLLLIGAAVGAIIGGGVSTVTQLVENNWDFEEVNWGLVAVDAVFGSIDGALSVTGMGLAGTILANSLLSGAQTIIQDLVVGDTSNTGNKIWASMGIAMLTSFLPGGYNGKKMAGIFNTSTASIVSSNSAKKVAMYQAKQKLVKKTILKQTAKYIGSTTANDLGSWGLDLLIGW